MRGALRTPLAPRSQQEVEPKYMDVIYIYIQEPKRENLNLNLLSPSKAKFGVALTGQPPNFESATLTFCSALPRLCPD